MPDLNQKLEHKLLQKLSPQQIQLIKLLEIPIIELEQRIKKEIEENPALEDASTNADDDDSLHRKEDDELENTEKEKKEEIDDYDNPAEEEIPEKNLEEEFSVDDYIEDDEIPSYKLKDNNYGEETDSAQTFYSVNDSFHEFLETQLSVLNLDETTNLIATYIIGSLDEAGYLRREINSIASDLLLLYNVSVSPEQVLTALNIVQNELEPPGVAAQNLRETLLLQLKRKLKNNENDEVLNLAYIIIDDYFEIFSKKHYEKIKNKLNIDDDMLREIVKEVLKLNPKPGNAYSIQNKQNFLQIIPDFVLKNINEELTLSLNSINVPSLKINKDFETILKTYNEGTKENKRNKDAVTFVKQKLDSAKWFIEAIKQRQNTLLNTMNSILSYQKEFFLTGDETKLKPMILKDIAQITHLDISTISRVANSKYIQTPYGIFPLKYFFSEGMENDQGEEVSTRKIKKILKEAIEKENKKKPLTDEKLAKLLQDKGYKIARRTVAKYREQMGILVARLRKKI